MPTDSSFSKLLDRAVDNRCQEYIAAICDQQPQVVRWLEHLLGKSISYAIFEYKDNYPCFKNAALAVQVAGSTGRLIAAETKLSRNWQDVRSLFKVLLTLTLCSPSNRFTNALASVAPELYRHLCAPDGRILVAIVNNKPVYMDMPVFDVVYPELQQPYVNILRRCLNDGDTPSYKLARSFNAALTQAVSLVLTFSWVFFDAQTLTLVPSRLLGAKVLLFSTDKPPNATLLKKNWQTKVAPESPLPLSGTSICVPANSIGVTKIILWQRDQWLVALLTHGNAGNSIVMTNETLGGHLSLWRLLASSSTPIASDPLANLVFTSYREYNESK